MSDKLVNLSVDDLSHKFARKSIKKTLPVFMNAFMISLIKDSLYKYFFNKALEQYKVVKDYLLNKILLKDNINGDLYENFNDDDLIEDLSNPFVDSIINDIIPNKDWIDIEDGYYDLSSSNNLNYDLSIIFFKKLCIKYREITKMVSQCKICAQSTDTIVSPPKVSFEMINYAQKRLQKVESVDDQFDKVDLDPWLGLIWVALELIIETPTLSPAQRYSAALFSYWINTHPDTVAMPGLAPLISLGLTLREQENPSVKDYRKGQSFVNDIRSIIEQPLVTCTKCKQSFCEAHSNYAPIGYLNEAPVHGCYDCFVHQFKDKTEACDFCYN